LRGLPGKAPHGLEQALCHRRGILVPVSPHGFDDPIIFSLMSTPDASRPRRGSYSWTNGSTGLPRPQHEA
jgi:hypothetical protein